MRVFGGSCVAVAFVTGAVALLWSLFPRASAGQIKIAVAAAQGGVRPSVAPPLLDAWQAYLALAQYIAATFWTWSLGRIAMTDCHDGLRFCPGSVRIACWDPGA